MDRYSYKFDFIPMQGRPGAFMFYFDCTVWVDDRCVSTLPIFQREIYNIGEVVDRSHILGNGQGMADLAYQLVSEHYANRNRPSDGEVNARPGSASVPS